MLIQNHINEQAFSLMQLNKSTQQSWLTDENLMSVLQLTTRIIKPDLKRFASAMQAEWSH